MSFPRPGVAWARDPGAAPLMVPVAGNPLEWPE